MTRFGMNQTKLAKYLGISLGTLGAISAIYGQIYAPRSDFVHKLARNLTSCYAPTNEVPSIVSAIRANRGRRGSCRIHTTTENRRTGWWSFWRIRQLELGISHAPRPRERTFCRHYHNWNNICRIIIDIAIIKAKSLKVLSQKSIQKRMQGLSAFDSVLSTFMLTIF